MMKKLIKLLREPNLALKYIINKISPYIKNDEFYLKLKFRINMGYRLDLKKPKTFNQKLQWLKLHDHKPEYAMMVDKYAVKQYVADRLGEEYVIPTLGVWNSVDEIDFDTLPNQFVLKCTHDSGGLCICRDKSKLNIEQVKKRLRIALKHNYFSLNREWPYKYVQKRIIAEQLLLSNRIDFPGNLPSYKFYCADGEPRYCQVIKDRKVRDVIDLCAIDWNKKRNIDSNVACPNDNKLVGDNAHSVMVPKKLEIMIDICRRVSKNMPFVHVNLCTEDDKKYLGEIKSYYFSESEKFSPDIYKNILDGEIIDTENINGGNFVAFANGDIFPCNGEVNDYKFFCFNGKVHCFKVDFNRFTNHQANYYDSNGNLLNFGEKACPPDYNHIEILPSNLKKMIMLAEKLSAGHVFMRVDFYNINGHIYFGELTFFPAGGIGLFTTNEADEYLGNLIHINKHN